jgi:hypothetical protein
MSHPLAWARRFLVVVPQPISGPKNARIVAPPGATLGVPLWDCLTPLLLGES